MRHTTKILDFGTPIGAVIPFPFILFFFDVPVFVFVVFHATIENSSRIVSENRVRMNIITEILTV